MRIAWVGVVLIACSIPDLDGTEKECPCADGYVCDETRNRCVEIDADDAGIDDAGFDVGLRRDAGRDDAGNDAGGEDADVDVDADVEPDVGVGRDSGDLDATVDEDAGGPDASAGDCPYDGLYCTNFEEMTPPYEVRGSGEFTLTDPGFMSDHAGRYRSEGSAIFTEFDRVSLPPTVHVRFWMHVESGFDDEAAILGVFVPGGSAAGIGITVQVEGGSATIKAISTASPGFVSARSTNVWTCVQLVVQPTRLELFIDDRFEGSAGIVPFADDFDDVGFGVIEGAHAGDEIIIDEVIVGASPIPCDLVE